MTTYQLRHKCCGEFPINHDREACEAIPELLSSIQESINQAINSGAERIELRYHNIPDDFVNPHGDIGMVRVIAYREVKVKSYDLEK